MIKEIFNFLKRNGHSTARDITNGLQHYNNDKILETLGKLVDSGLLKVSCSGKYRIVAFIDGRISQDRTEGLYNYARIQEAIENVPAQSIPSKYINPNVYKIARRDQGDRGTCVGQSTAYAFDLNMMKLTDWIPDLSQIKRNIVIEVGSSKIIKDELPEGSASAECLYHLSRELGNVTHPSGSYVEFGAKAWNKMGICFESDWWTSKTPLFGNISAYPGSRDKCIPEAAKHTIAGYATTQDFEAIKRAIYTNGFVLMPIAIYENWTANNQEGLFPNPKGEEIGSHALCWVGYDENNLYCIHSWADWSLLGGISREYFSRRPMMAYIPLDDVETKFAKEIYCKLTITTSDLCDITVGNDVFKATKEFKGAFPKGYSLRISARPLDSSLIPVVATREILINEDTTLPLEFSKHTPIANITAPITKPTKSVIKTLIDILRNIFKWKN